MPRTVVFVALTLMLLTGFVLGQLRGLVSPGSATVPDANPMALQTATDFYEAVNAVLDSGDPAHLRAMVHPGYIDHSQPEGAGTLGDLEASLLALREAFP